MSPEFEQLRAFQRSLMARISDASFHADYESDPQAAAAKFGLTDPDWNRKLKDCDQGYVHRLAETWAEIAKQEAEAKRRYESAEWSAWAQEMKGAGEL